MSAKPTQNTMHSNIEFKNLGKIKEANIQIRPFTVIAGCNSSGKSFITKSLYSLFSGVRNPNTEYLTVELIHELSQSYHNFHPLLIWASERFESVYEKLDQQISSLDRIPLKEITLFSTSPLLEDISASLKKFETLFKQEIKKPTKPSTSSEIKGILDTVEMDEHVITEFFQQINKSLQNLIDYLSNPDDKLNDAITKSLAESFRDNFTIPSTKQLIHFNSESATISSGQFGSVKITSMIQTDKDTLSKISALNSHPPIYLESPVYWKLRDALEDSKRALISTAMRRNLSGNQLVSKVPKYFFDVIELLDDQVKTDQFNDIAQTIEDAIKGSLSISDGGIQFVDKESNKAVSLSVTALGVTNLGMIALLLRRGAILPGTFLFIDEPEVHLHPMWQVVLVQVLHELSKRGVNVVIASHSIDIMKAIENIMKNDENIDQQAHFGLNQLTSNGHSVDVTDNNFKRIAAIKEDLGKPFYDMFMGA